MKFLLIDDHELIRETMRGALQQLDDEVEYSRGCGRGAGNAVGQIQIESPRKRAMVSSKYDTYPDQLGVKFPQFVKP